MCGLLLCAGAGGALAERHYGETSKSCAIPVEILLPLKLVRQADSMPSQGGWYARAGAEVLYVADGGLQAMAPATGASRTAVPGLDSAARYELAAGSAAVYLLSADASAASAQSALRLRAYSVPAFESLWTVDYESEAPPFVRGLGLSGSAIILAADNKLSAYDAANGRVLWRRDTRSFLGNVLASAQGLVLAPTMAGLAAFSAADGSTAWEFPLPGSPYNPQRYVSISSATAYFPLTDSVLGAVDLKTGALLWKSTPLTSPIDPRHPPIHAPEGIFILTRRGVARLSPDGAAVWERAYPFLGMRQGLPAMLAASNVLLIGASDGVVALSLDSGEIAWEHAGIGEVADIDLVDGSVIAVNLLGRVHVFAH